MTPLDARVAGFTLEESSNYIAKVTQKALKQAWQERQPDYLRQQVKLAGILVVSAIALSTIIWLLQKQLKKREAVLREQKISCEHRMNANMIRMAEEEVSSTGYCHTLATEQLQNRRMLGSQGLQSYLLQITQGAIWLGVIALILGLFPFTRAWEWTILELPLLLGVLLIAIAELGSDHYLGWGNLLHSIKTGEIAFDNVAGMNVWEYYQQHPEDGKPFERAMTNVTKTILEAVLASYDFSGFNRVIDVGGGRGSLLAAILQSNPTVCGVLFDLPTVIDSAKTIFESEGLSDRCDLVAGDFFTSVPTGGDAYLLKWIIHDWEETKALTILKNCHQAMVDGGKLLLFEQVIPTGNEPNFAKLLDLNMLVMTGGRERTEAEYQTLLQLAGFKLTRIVATDSPTSIIEAVKS